MRILILSNEVWNDQINGNNLLTNWFDSFNGVIANIYLSSGIPFNNCCNSYFQITDRMMIKSLIADKAGRELVVDELKVINGQDTNKKTYQLLKKFSCNFTRFARQLVWLLGRYNIVNLTKFIDKFKPDIIFTERMASPKILRFERLIKRIANVPMIAFTGDDEYSLKQFSLSPSFWIVRFITRIMLRKNVQMYSIYYTLSHEQSIYYQEEFGVRTKVLQKCGSPNKHLIDKKINNPIKMIYAGKFYCNRWKSLSQIVSVIKEINNDRVKITLDIYTKDSPTKKQNLLLNDGINVIIKGPITQEELNQLYPTYDISVHVESLDLKNRLSTRYSFSTKIIDCIFSGTAVLAYCDKEHAGLTYLKREDAGLCVINFSELRECLFNVVDNEWKIMEYKHKALSCGIKNNDKNKIRNMLYKDFNEVINESSSN